jgi:hypothetical protein
MTTTIQQPKLSQHSKIRLQQRGIHQEEVQTVLHFGKVIHKQGLKFHYLPKAVIRTKGLDHDARLSSLIVITDRSGREVITCYKSDRGVHRIKKKSKRLYRNNQSPNAD